VNNNFIRSGQNKNNNNRNRNRNNNNNRRNTGGNLGGGSGNNKVFDSNGPDIKLRGTTQTIAEKYMQLGRDAQSSGDTVAAENYYQHAEHYYRLWAANQPVGHSLQMSRKLGEDELEEEGEDNEGGEDEAPEVEAPSLEAAPQSEGEAPVDGQQPRQNRNNNYRDNNNRGGNDRNFRPRWQNNRNNRNFENRDGAPEQAVGEAPAEFVASSPIAPAPAPIESVQEGQWEAPSFLQRPTPIATPVEAVAAVSEDAPAPRKYRPRKPRVEQDAAPVDEGSRSTE
jgi:Domain of unknown function (DUF4167)